MLPRLVRVLACLLIFLACIPHESGAYAFFSFMSPRKPLPPVVGHFSSRIGVPKVSGRAVAPRFQRFIRATDAVDIKTSTALITATESNMLAALNPRDGGIVWRRSFPEGVESVVGFEDHLVVFSGTNGTTLSIMHAKHGLLLHTTELEGDPHATTSTVSAAFYPSPEAADMVVLVGGTVQRLTQGQVDWRWVPEDRVDLQHVILSGDHIYVTALAHGKARPVIFRLTRRGTLVSSHTIPSDVVGQLVALPWTPRPHFPAARYATTDGGPHVAWLGPDGQVHAARIDVEDPSGSRKRIKARSGRFVRLIDVGLGDRGYFVAEREGYTSEALQVNERGKFVSVWEFEDASPEAVYDGTFDRASDAFINRITFTRSQQLLSLNFLWADAVLGSDRGQLSGMSFQFDHDMHGNVLAAPFEVSKQGPYKLATRVTLVTSSGSVQMFLNGEPKWRLEQGLAETTKTALIDLPDRGLGPAAISERFAHGATLTDSPLDTLEHEGFVHRVLRHLSYLAVSPRIVADTVADVSAVLTRERIAQFLFDARRKLQRTLQPTAGGAISRDANATAVLTAVREATNETLASLYHDHFGFRKVIVAGTARGRLYGIDQSLDASAMLWERSIAGYGDGEGGPEPEVRITNIVQTRRTGTLIDGVPLPPLVTVVAQIGLPGRKPVTHLFEINPLTGETAEQDGVEVSRSAASLHVLPITAANGELVLGALSDDGTSLAVHPNGTADVRVYLAAGTNGYTVDANSHDVHPTWSIALAPGERIVAAIDQSRDHVASLGRIRGDRSVMYKWLNPHARLIVTHDEAASVANAYVIDTVSGEIVHHVSIPNVVPDHGVKATFTENWITIHYSTDATAEGSDAQPAAPPLPYSHPNMNWEDDYGAGKTRRLVSIELFEPEQHSNASVSSFGQGASGGAVVPRSRPVAYSRSFLLPYGVLALGTSRTTLGVATRALIVATDRENLVVIPRRMLDPLRTDGRPAPADAAAGIIAYSPEIPDELAWRVSQRELRIMGLNALIAAPSFLESTSMVLATGVDWFYTSVSPSGQFDRLQASFNKTQLILTIAALLAAIAATRPLMRLRVIGRRW
ncbi:hypothetical protein MCUN1_003863 [Malassezia cuniculi]|uniref:ER membrane protein complex subunit 1 n=1 Tax=Malassezia cuniculi TaxID=948313 RepID=A0AAF0EZB0_9BASI|nr:hypothetical protein MCUN1_003863 [Malassezia cuniculi]